MMSYSPTLRPLAIFVEPVAGEAFASYVDRLAAAYDVPLTIMLERTGLTNKGQFQGRGYGVMLTGPLLQVFARVTRLDIGQIQRMLLARYDGDVIDLKGICPEERMSLSWVACNEWAFFSGSHACPGCVGADQGAWQLAWKIPWSFACLRHQALLVEMCPECGARFRTGRVETGTLPYFLSLVPKPGYCGNARPKGIARPGGNPTPCWHPVADVPYLSLAEWGGLMAAQKAINDVLAGGDARVAGEIVATSVFFGSLRSLCALILFAARPEEMPDNPPAVADAFKEHVAERDRRDQARNAQNWREAERTTVHRSPPQSPALMAAILPVALSILAADDRSDLAARMNPLVQRTRQRNAPYAWRIPACFGFIECLEWAYVQCLTRQTSFNRQIGKYSTPTTVEQPFSSLSPDYIPQLFWRDDFTKDFAMLLPGLVPLNGRRFCSMALVKLCTDCTWVEAAEKLGLPGKPGLKFGLKCMSILNAAGHTKTFGIRLRNLAARLVQCPPTVNYARRRQQFVTFTDIPENDWRMILTQSGVSANKSSGRRRFATAWLWAEATGSDASQAPVFQVNGHKYQRMCYARFIKHDLHLFEQALWAYLSLLIKKLK